ncbi:MAG: hypothetical protein GC204_00265 [Chloroflexi bacterium]|nr:hypothetical protein [Chloroflexota bacterium]
MRKFAIVGFYALLAVVALYNPLFHLSTSLTGLPVTDFYHFHWNYWWIRHALNNGLNVYLTNYLLAPTINNLAFHTLTPFFYPIWALLEPLIGTVAAMTAIFIFAMSASAVAFYALLRREGVSIGLALVGGAMLELTPLMFTAVFWTNINLMGWFWLPLLILTWGEMVRTAAPHPKSLSHVNGERDFKPPSAPPLHRERGAGGEVKRKLILLTLLLGATIWAMLLTDLQYALLNAFVIVPYALWMLWRVGSMRARIKLVIAGFVAVGIAVALLWFVGPLPYIFSFDGSDLALTPVDQAVSVPFPLGFLWHDDPDGTRHVSFGAIFLPLLLIAIALSFVGAHGRAPLRSRLGRMRWFWLALVPLPLLFTAGAAISVLGAQITLPYLWLHNLFGGMFRYPERFVPVALIPGVLFAMLTLTPILARRRLARWIVPAALMFLVIADSHMLDPFPIQPIPTHYAFYDAIGKEPYDEVVLEVPTAAMSGEGIVGDSRDVQVMFYGIYHGKRMVNAHLSRVPISNYWYMRTDDPMLAWLGQRRYIDPPAVEAQMKQRIFDYPIGYFVIHRDRIGGVGSVTDQEILGYFNSLRDLVCPLWIEGDAIVYRTAWHPDGCPARIPPQDANGDYLIDIGATDDLHYIGWGWHQAETISGLTLRWTGEYPQTQVYFDLPAGGYTLTISAQSFYEPRRLRLLINDEPVSDPVTVTPDALHPYSFSVPAEVIGSGQHLKLTLDYDATVVPAEVGQGSDSRKLAVAVDTISFAPER